MQKLTLKQTVLSTMVALAATLVFVTPPAQATTDAEQARNDGFWLVESGQWLGRIVARLESDPARRGRLMEEIVFLNPQAFVNADPNRMRAGARLTLPDAYSATAAAAAQPEPDPAATAQPEVATDAVGRVTVVRGAVTATDAAGRQRPLSRRSYIRNGDTLDTGPRSGAHIRFNDGAQIALRRDSSLRIDEYAWQGSEDGSESAALSLIKGGFRTITGAIGRTNRDNYLVKSPFATIGIRGTHYALMACVAGACNDYGANGGTPEEGLYGGTAFGAIGVDGETIAAQQYFFHDGQDLDIRFEPPPFLFAADTAIGDAAEDGGPDGSAGGSSDGGADDFASDGNTESGGLLGQTLSPSTDGVFTEGEEQLAEQGEQAEQPVDFDPFNFDFGADLSDLESLIGSFLAAFGNFTAAPSGAGAYGAWVQPGVEGFHPEDFYAHVNGGPDFFFSGDFGGKPNVLAAALSTDSPGVLEDIDVTFFLGPPEGQVLAQQTVSEPGFTASLGRWDRHALLIDIDGETGELNPFVDDVLVGEFVHSNDVTSEAQLANLGGLGMRQFQNVATLGSDELGAGFAGNYAAGDVQMMLVADFANMQIMGGSMNVNDASGRQWSLSQGSPVPLEIDAELFMSGFCLGCNGGSDNAFGWMFFTALGSDAQGGMGSFGAHADVGPEAIAGVNVFKNVGPYPPP